MIIPGAVSVTFRDKTTQEAGIICTMAQEKGIKVALEQFLNDAETLQELLREESKAEGA